MTTNCPVSLSLSLCLAVCGEAWHLAHVLLYQTMKKKKKAAQFSNWIIVAGKFSLLSARRSQAGRLDKAQKRTERRHRQRMMTRDGRLEGEWWPMALAIQRLNSLPVFQCFSVSVFECLSVCLAIEWLLPAPFVAIVVSLLCLSVLSLSLFLLLPSAFAQPFNNNFLVYFQDDLPGQALLDVVFARLNLIETSYFGIRYIDDENQTVSAGGRRGRWGRSPAGYASCLAHPAACWANILVFQIHFRFHWNSLRRMRSLKNEDKKSFPPGPGNSLSWRSRRDKSACKANYIISLSVRQTRQRGSRGCLGLHWNSQARTLVRHKNVYGANFSPVNAEHVYAVFSI